MPWSAQTLRIKQPISYNLPLPKIVQYLWGEPEGLVSADNRVVLPQSER